MPIFYIHATNSSFRSLGPPKEHESANAALRAGIRAGIEIAADEVRSGSPNAMVEVCIADVNNDVVLRSAVSVSVSPLLAT
jgi:hypothetical protein